MSTYKVLFLGALLITSSKVTINTDIQGIDKDPSVSKFEDPLALPNANLDQCQKRRLFGVQFVDYDKKLNFWRPGHPIHGWFTNTCRPGDTFRPIVGNKETIDLDPSSAYSETLSVDMPFHMCHSLHEDWQPGPMCEMSYLALATTMELHQKADGAQTHTFIVQADHVIPSANCDHKNHLDDGRKLGSWTAVAYLAGWRQGHSSLGTVVAVSPEGTKIAAAIWDRVILYSLNPTLLHQGELEHYFPARDYNARKGFGRLRPVLLPSDGVVHRMVWREETQLYATTDRGLVKWDLEATCHSKRKALSLTYATWPPGPLELPG